MSPEYPYQIVAFLDEQPVINELIYDGDNGWYPQIALKRRFGLRGIGEAEFEDFLRLFCKNHQAMTIVTKDEYRPARMPVDVIEVALTEDLAAFHNDIIEETETFIASRYPERDGANYLPHVTSQYDGKRVIDASIYVNRNYIIDRVCLVKDNPNKGTCAHTYFELNR